MPISSKRWRGLLRVVSYPPCGRVSRRGAKALGFQDDRDCHKFTIWNNKIIDWIICKEYLGIGDGFALNLFRLCLDARTGWGGRVGDISKKWRNKKPLLLTSNNQSFTIKIPLTTNHYLYLCDKTHHPNPPAQSRHKPSPAPPPNPRQPP